MKTLEQITEIHFLHCAMSQAQKDDVIFFLEEKKNEKRKNFTYYIDYTFFKPENSEYDHLKLLTDDMDIILIIGAIIA
jgi:hypothetical protein